MLIHCHILYYVGDFNEDILHHSNPTIVNFMSGLGYVQAVTSPTTARSMLIDHIYSNLPSYCSLPVQVRDTYYSDHDTLYCSFPLANTLLHN